ncbi:ATP-binding cassette domain-containing protein [Clostridioides difficile]
MSVFKLEDVVFKDNDNLILNGINLEVNKGDCISVIGPSGGGKSTLLKIMADLITVSKGDIKYKDKHYRDYDPLTLRRSISYCIQLPYLFGNTVFDNLSFPFLIRKENINKHRIIELLSKFNLSSDYLNKDVKNLSGGEKQRISIIRSLVYIPEVLLLDEATSALDKENVENVESIIEQLNKEGVTVIWITHNIEQSERIFNKRIKIKSGKIETVEMLKTIERVVV